MALAGACTYRIEREKRKVNKTAEMIYQSESRDCLGKKVIKLNKENEEIKKRIDALISELCERLNRQTDRAQPEMIMALASLIEARDRLD